MVEAWEDHSPVATIHVDLTMATKYVLCQVGFLLCSFRLWRSQDTSEWSESPITQFLAFTWRIP